MIVRGVFDLREATVGIVAKKVNLVANFNLRLIYINYLASLNRKDFFLYGGGRS
jgi:hypothetical protein